MHPLAFDKHGRPFALDRRTKKLLVRKFNSPGTRGTCAQVFDPTGERLYIDADADQLGFRRLVGYAPGLYRLDQCDEDGVEIEGAPPAYVSVETGRNTSYLADNGADVNPLTIIERLVATQADVMKTMAAQQAALISASAEILRAPYRPAPAIAVDKDRDEKRDDDDVCEDCDDAADGDDEAPADPWAALRPVMDVIEPHVPKLGAFLYEQLVAFLNRSKAQAAQPPAAPSPAVAPAPTPASAPTAATPAAEARAESVGAAAGPSSSAPAAHATTTAHKDPGVAPATAPSQPTAIVESEIAMAPSADGGSDLGESETLVDNADIEMPSTAGSDSAPVAATVATSPASASSGIEHAASPAAAATSTMQSVAAPTSLALAVAEAPPPRNAPPEPTPQQVKHLLEIRQQLSVKEQAIAQNAMSRMTPAVLAQWLAELSALSVDDATRMLRQMIGNLRTPRNRGRG